MARIIFIIGYFILTLFIGKDTMAHPMPYSVLFLDFNSNNVSAELQFPLKEFQLVFPEEDIDSNYQTLIIRKDKWLDNYLLNHMSVTDSSGQKWSVEIKGKSMRDDEQNLTGKYHELIFQLLLQPPAGASVRKFILHYDAIMHQLITHKLWIKIRSDWSGGLSAKDSLTSELGILGVNFSDNSVPPVVINLDDGNNWIGFTSMVNLGVQHISEGTDHLLFLLVLLLPATLAVRKRRWAEFIGTKTSLIRLIKIATAFTIGHSVSLLIGAMKWIVLPQQPVEVAIAITILITAVHALRPVFPGKELRVAAGFGLIHGLAFATVLSELNLESGKMALSILGFNIGIELMQLFVILLTVPWLIILSENPLYKWFRISGAILAIIIAMGWIAERITLKANIVSSEVLILMQYAKWIVLFLASLATLSYLQMKLISEKYPENS